MNRPMSEHVRPAIAIPLGAPGVSLALLMLTPPKMTPRMTSGHAMMPMIGMNEKTRPTMPHTREATAIPLVGCAE